VSGGFAPTGKRKDSIMRIKIALIALVAVVLAASGIAYAKSQVPFKASGSASLTESEVVGVIDGSLVIRNEFEGTAKGTQLGRSTLEGVQLFSVVLTDIVPDTWIEGTFSQTQTFTAANGDELDVASEGTFLVYVTEDVTFVPVSGQGVSEITGGTGRFAGATGKAKLSTGLDDDFNVTFKMNGTISSLGSRGGNGKK
jgi:hypothetical protein